jgi:hypothetical protein
VIFVPVGVLAVGKTTTREPVSMSTYNLDLYFVAGDTGKGEFPGAAAQVRVQTSTSDPTHSETFISPQCVSEREFSAQIRRLKSELDEIEREGVRNFRRYDEKIFGRSRS